MSFKILTATTLLLLTTFFSQAQKVSYKNDVLNVDDTDIAKIVRIKDKGSFGLISTYELDALTGEKLVIAKLATDYVPNRNDNSTYYYRFTFLTTDQVAIFSMSKLSPEKSFANLIGQGGIVVNNQLDKKKITELIALKSDNPVVDAPPAEVYQRVERSNVFPVKIEAGGLIYQGRVLIGNFKKVATRGDRDIYEFGIPQGLIIARVSFVGKNAKSFTIWTLKDRRDLNVETDIDKNFGAVIISSVDINETSLTRAAKWLVKENYL